MSTEIITKRGRPPAYDRDQALAALTDMFWLKGFAATSLDDLSGATGMARPSLYAAFGDKQTMYLAGIDRVRGLLAVDLGALEAEPDLKTALRNFFRRAVDVYLSGGDHPRGCLAVCTAATAAAMNVEIRTALAGIIAMIDEALFARIARAADDGQIAANHDVRGAALLTAAALHSLAIRARAGRSRNELEALIDAAVRSATVSQPTGAVRAV